MRAQRHCKRLALGLLLVAGGCSRGCKPSADSQPRAAAPARAHGGRLVVGLPEEPDQLNMLGRATRATRLVTNCIFSRFVTWDDSLQLVPDLITEIPTHENGGISADDLTYTYHLRHDVHWHDGPLLTSADVRFTYDVIMDSSTATEVRPSWEVVAACTTPDSFTVVFRLAQPYAAFVSDAFSDEDVLPQHLLAGFTGAKFQSAPFHHAPVGSGPFRFKEWVAGSYLAVVRNDAYYKGAPPLDEIAFKFVPDANALALQLQSGAVQVVDGAEPAQMPILVQRPDIRVLQSTSFSFDQLTFQCTDPILRDVRVRRALAAATDRATLAKNVYEGFAVPAYSEAHPRVPWHEAAGDTANAYDPARAAALFEAAGWHATGNGIRARDHRPLRLVITTMAGRAVRERVEAVLQQEWRAVGVELAISNCSPPEFFDKLTTGKFQIALFGFQQEPDPAPMDQVYGSRFTPENGQNFARFSDARVDSLLEAGKHERNRERRWTLYRDVERILGETQPLLPLVWLTELDVVPRALHGYRPNPTSAGDTYNVDEWWLEPSTP